MGSISAHNINNDNLKEAYFMSLELDNFSSSDSGRTIAENLEGVSGLLMSLYLFHPSLPTTFRNILEFQVCPRDATRIDEFTRAIYDFTMGVLHGQAKLPTHLMNASVVSILDNGRSLWSFEEKRDSPCIQGLLVLPETGNQAEALTVGTKLSHYLPKLANAYLGGAGDLWVNLLEGKERDQPAVDDRCLDALVQWLHRAFQLSQEDADGYPEIRMYPFHLGTMSWDIGEQYFMRRACQEDLRDKLIFDPDAFNLSIG